jgi:hypothetical protein
MGLTWDADSTVLTAREKTPDAWFRYRAGFLPAYPILKRDSDQILDRNNGIWLLLRNPFSCAILPASHSPTSSASQTIHWFTISILSGTRDWWITRQHMDRRSKGSTVSLILP